MRAERPPFASRLREWWSNRSKEVATQSKARDFLREWKQDRDLGLYFRGRLMNAYPPGTVGEWNWFVVYRGAAYLAPSYAYAKGLAERLMRLDNVPPLFAPTPGIVHAKNQSVRVTDRMPSATELI